MSNFLASNSSQPGNEVAENTKQQFLQFYLDSEIRVMLPVAQITEVLKIELARIVPIPQMPPWVMGVYNWRGDILWMVDLGHLLGLNSWYQRGRSSADLVKQRQALKSFTGGRTKFVAPAIGLGNCNVVILSPNKAIPQAEDNIDLGLVVYRVEDLEECDLTEIQSTLDKTAAQIANFASGYWLKPGGEIVSVLDGNAIARAMPTLVD